MYFAGVELGGMEVVGSGVRRYGVRGFGTSGVWELVGLDFGGGGP